MEARMAQYLLAVLYLVSQLGVLFCSPCTWQLTVFPTSNFSREEDHILDNAGASRIGEAMVHWDITNLNASPANNGPGYCVYHYSLKLTLLCDGQPSGFISSLVLEGIEPVLTMCKQSPQSYAVRCAEMEAAPIAAGVFSGVSCSSSLCDMAWALPLPLDDNTTVFHLTVDTHGLAETVPPRSVSLVVSGYERTAPLGEALLAAIRASKRQVHIQFLPGVTPALVLGPLTTGGATVTFDLDHGPFSTLQVSVVGEEEFCRCQAQTDKGPVYDVAILTDRIIYSTVSGVYELLGSFTENRCPGCASLSRRRVLAACVDRLTISTQGLAHQQHVLAAGVCQHEGTLYSGTTSDTEGASLELVELSGAETACMEATGAESCHLVTSAATSQSFTTHTAFFLVYSLQPPNHTHAFTLLHYKGEPGQGDWEVLQEIPAAVPSSVSDVFSEPLLMSYPLEDAQLELVIKGVTLTPWASRHRYIWGNRILHSPDGGHSVYLLPWRGNADITSLVINQRGLLALLTTDQQIWLGVVGSSVLRLVLPTPGWDAVFTLRGLRPLVADTHIISLFFDLQDNLQLVIIEDEMKRVTVPMQDILSNMVLSLNPALFKQSGAVLPVSELCPFKDIIFESVLPQMYTRQQYSTYRGPELSHPEHLHGEKSLSVYHAITEMLTSQYRTTARSYKDKYRNYIDRWKDQNSGHKSYHQLLFQNSWLKDGIHVDLDQYKILYRVGSVQSRTLPATVYLGKHQKYTFTLYLFLNDAIVSSSGVTAGLDHLQVSVTLSDTTHLSVHVHREDQPLHYGVKYQITLIETGVLQQSNPPGVNLYPASLELAVWDSTFQCFHQENGNKQLQGNYYMPVLVGCPPDQRVLLDWQAARDRLTDPDVSRTPYDCMNPNPDLYCFYFDNNLYPFFLIEDKVIGEQWRYTGKYTLKVIGGSSVSQDDIQHFTEEQIILCNNQKDLESLSLIWNAVEDAIVDNETGWPIYSHKHNAIQWMCKSQSPCSNIYPFFPNAPQYYFLVEFATTGVDEENSHCELTLQFVLHIHGLPMDPINMSVLLVLWAMVGVMIHLILYYICHLHDNWLWGHLVGLLPKSKEPAELPEKGQGEHSQASVFDYKEAVGAWRDKLRDSLAGSPEMPVAVTDTFAILEEEESSVGATASSGELTGQGEHSEAYKAAVDEWRDKLRDSLALGPEMPVTDTFAILEEEELSEEEASDHSLSAQQQHSMQELSVKNLVDQVIRSASREYMEEESKQTETDQAEADVEDTRPVTPPKPTAVKPSAKTAAAKKLAAASSKPAYGAVYATPLKPAARPPVRTAAQPKPAAAKSPTKPAAATAAAATSQPKASAVATTSATGPAVAMTSTTPPPTVGASTKMTETDIGQPRPVTAPTKLERTSTKTSELATTSSEPPESAGTSSQPPP